MELALLFISPLAAFYDPLIWVPSVAAALLIRKDWRMSLFAAAVVAAAYGFAGGMLVHGYVDTTKPAFAFMDPIAWALINVAGATLIWAGVRLAAMRTTKEREPGAA